MDMTESAMRFGLSGCSGGLESAPPANLLALAAQAEAWGFASLWLNEEHFQTPAAGDGRLCFSPVILATAIAARTTRIRVGFSVLLLPLHHPLRLAEEIATLDVLSGGRVDFGISRGGNGRYFAAYGLDPEQRTAQFRDTLAFILRCWTDDTVTVGDGDERYAVQPKPIQRPHPPVYIGGYSDDSIQWAAQTGHSLILHGIQSVASLRRCLDIFHAAGGDVGQVPTGRFVYVGESDEVARREAWPTVVALTTRLKRIGISRSGLVMAAEDLEPERFFREMAIIGGPETVTARIGELRDTLGVRYLNLLPAFFGYLPEALLEHSLALFSEAVMPQFRGQETERPITVR